MAEAVALAASLLTIAATASTLCQSLYQTLSALKDGPKYLRHIHSDLEDFCNVLGTLQALLHDEETVAGVVQPVTSINLQNVLKTSVGIFKELSCLIKPLDEQGRSVSLVAWQRFKWILRERETLELRKMLITNKITLNVAISIANYCNSNASNARGAKMQADTLTHIRQLEETLPSILSEIEEIKAAQLPEATSHTISEREVLKADYNYALRNFVNDATSMFSGGNISNDPSMQVSSFRGSEVTGAKTFYTARSQIAARSINASTAEPSRRLSIRDVTRNGSSTLQAGSEHDRNRVNWVKKPDRAVSFPETRRSSNSTPHSSQVGRAFTENNRKKWKLAVLFTNIRLRLGISRAAWADSDFRNRSALDFPDFPGEAHRNAELSTIRERWNLILTEEVLGSEVLESTQRRLPMVPDSTPRPRSIHSLEEAKQLVTETAT